MLGFGHVKPSGDRDHDDHKDDPDPSATLATGFIFVERLVNAEPRVVFGALHFAYEAHRSFIGIERKKSRIAPHERQNVELVGGQRIIVVLHHLQIAFRDSRLADDFLARDAAPFTRGNQEASEIRLRLGPVGVSRPRNLITLYRIRFFD